MITEQNSTVHKQEKPARTKTDLKENNPKHGLLWQTKRKPLSMTLPSLIKIELQNNRET